MFTAAHANYIVIFLLLGSLVGQVPAMEQELANKQAFDVDITLHRCKSERGVSSFGHQEWLNRLDRKRIVFVGDSITRYQYLELAYFLTYGSCPDQKSEYGYILSEKDFPDWNEFFRNSSAVLNVLEAPRHTRETCLCSRLQLMPTLVNERRHYIYEDIEGRRIELMYLQYFNEKFELLTSVTNIAETLQPTDLVMNFGAWLVNTEPYCGDTEGEISCPHIDWLCNYLQQEHPFRTWWLTTTPRVDDNVVSSMADSHHLNIPVRCKLPPSQVLDRMVVINILQPEPSRQPQLWWDAVHMHADANHAFNRQFVSRLQEEAPRSPQEQHQRGVWKHLFSRGQ